MKIDYKYQIQQTRKEIEEIQNAVEGGITQTPKKKNSMKQIETRDIREQYNPIIQNEPNHNQITNRPNYKNKKTKSHKSIHQTKTHHVKLT